MVYPEPFGEGLADNVSRVLMFVKSEFYELADRELVEWSRLDFKYSQECLLWYIYRSEAAHALFVLMRI